MRLAATVLLVLSVVFLAAGRLRARPDVARSPRPRPVAEAAARAPATGATAGIGPAALGPAPAVLARRFVVAMWTRPPGAAPFAWLGQVAAFTSPELLARLRAGLPTPGDIDASSVTVDGVYPDALDPDRLTVTCVAHVVSPAGLADVSCASTVTVAATAAGGFEIADVQ